MAGTFTRTGLALAVLFCTVASGRGAAFTVLHAFTNSTGGDPDASLILSSNLFYGAAIGGGSGGNGSLYKVKLDGTGFTNFYNFTPRGNNNTNIDGQGPHSLVLASNTLYGTTGEEGLHGVGTVFKVNMDGSGFKTLYAFLPASSSSNGLRGGVITLSGNVIFGTTAQGGIGNNGTVFRINTDGSSFTNLLNSTARQLLVISNVLYGIMGESLGSSGSIFRMNTDGGGFTNIYQFSPPLTNSDGINPMRLFLCGSVFYGVASAGGANDRGTLFKVNLDGSSFTTLHTFSAMPQYIPGSNTVSDVTNYDGASPDDLVVCGNTIYGAASGGGAGGTGTLFKLNTDGTGFTTLHGMSSLVWFTNVVGTTTYITYTNNDGIHPGGLLLSHGTLYGTASNGGGGQVGTLFGLMAPQPLNESISGHNLILQWDDTDFLLQSAPTPQGPWNTLTGSTSPYTNSLAGPMVFFRLQVN